KGAIDTLNNDIQGAMAGDQNDLALALHLIQDSYASGHQYKFWNGGILRSGVPSFGHANGDLARSSDAEVASLFLLNALQGSRPIGDASDYLFNPGNNCK